MSSPLLTVIITLQCFDDKSAMLLSNLPTLPVVIRVMPTMEVSG